MWTSCDIYDTVVGKRFGYCLQRERQWESDFSRHVGCDLGIAVSHSFCSGHTIPRPCIVVCMPTIHSATILTHAHAPVSPHSNSSENDHSNDATRLCSLVRCGWAHTANIALIFTRC